MPIHETWRDLGTVWVLVKTSSHLETDPRTYNSLPFLTSRICVKNHLLTFGRCVTGVRGQLLNSCLLALNFR